MKENLGRVAIMAGLLCLLCGKAISQRPAKAPSSASSQTLSSASSISIAKSRASALASSRSTVLGKKKSTGLMSSTVSPSRTKLRAAPRKKNVVKTPLAENRDHLATRIKDLKNKEQELATVQDRSTRASKRRELHGLYSEVAQLYKKGSSLTKDPAERSWYTGMAENFTVRSKGGVVR